MTQALYKTRSLLLIVFSLSLLLFSCSDLEKEEKIDDSLLFKIKDLFISPILDSVMSFKDSEIVVIANNMEAASASNSVNLGKLTSRKYQGLQNKADDFVQNANNFNLSKKDLENCASYQKKISSIEKEQKTIAPELNNAFSWTSNSDMPLYLLGEYSYITSFNRSCDLREKERKTSHQAIEKEFFFTKEQKTQTNLSIQSLGNRKVQTLQIKKFDLPNMNKTKLGKVAKQRSIRFVRTYQTTSLDDKRLMTIEHEIQVRTIRKHDDSHYFNPNKTLLNQRKKDLYLQQRFTFIMTDVNSVTNNAKRQLIGVFSNYKYSNSCQYLKVNEKTDYSNYEIQADGSGLLNCVGSNITIEDITTDTMVYAAVIDKKLRSSYAERIICSNPEQASSSYRPQECNSRHTKRKLYVNAKTKNSKHKHKQAQIRRQLSRATGKVKHQIFQYGKNNQFPVTIEQAAKLLGALHKTNLNDMKPRKILGFNIKKRGKDKINSNLYIESIWQDSDGTVKIKWPELPKAESYNVYAAKESFKNTKTIAEEYYHLVDAQVIGNVKSPAGISDLDTENQYYFVLTAIEKGREVRSFEVPFLVEKKPPQLKQTANKSYSLILGEAITPIVFDNNGGTIKSGSCTARPKLPKGLNIKASGNKCVITGTPVMEKLETTYNIIATNTGGINSTPKISIRVYFPITTGLAIGYKNPKTFSFQWHRNPSAAVYYLYENIRGNSGFNLIARIPKGKTSYNHIIPLWQRIDSEYLIKSCYSVNKRVCGIDSNTVTPSKQGIIDSIGYFKADNTKAGYGFGSSVSIDGNTFAVGSVKENNAEGAVYVFQQPTNNNWKQKAYIKASNKGTGDSFGYSISLNGNSLAVGAPKEDSDTRGIGDQSNDNGINNGAVYVFTRNKAKEWTQQAYIKASNAGVNDLFGYSVSLSGDTVAVGAPKEDSDSKKIGTLSNDNGANNGAVYVFTRNSNGQWTQQAYIKASNAGVNDLFGYSVSLSGDTLVVGAPKEDSDTRGIRDQSNDNGVNNGAAYVFTRDSSGNWAQQAYLKASNTGDSDLFGYSVSLSGDTVAVGAPEEDSDTRGIGDQSNDNGVNNGAAYVFTRNNSNEWTQQAYIKASNTEDIDLFGHSLSLNGNSLAVGAPEEDSNATGIDGDQGNDLAVESGAAYVFMRNSNGQWTQQAYLKASNTDPDDWFGDSISFDGKSIVVGARHERSAAKGIQGEQSSNTETKSGAAYMF